MPSRSLKLFLLEKVRPAVLFAGCGLGALFCVAGTASAQSISDAYPAPPYTRVDLGGGSFAAYFAGYKTTPTAGVIVDDGAGFSYFDFDKTQVTGDSGDVLLFDVELDRVPSASRRGLVMVKVDGQLVPIAYAGTTAGVTSCLSSGAPCQLTPPTGYSSSFSWAARYSGELTVRVGVFPKDVCQAVNDAVGGTSSGCSGGAVNFPTSGPAALSFSFYVIENPDDETTPAPTALTTAAKTLSVRLMPYAAPLALEACAESTERYRPGDGEIEVNTSKLDINAVASSAPPAEKVLVAGAIGVDPDTSDLDGNPVFARLAYDGWSKLEGLTNTTDIASPVSYHLTFALRDRAGVMTTPGCELRGVVVSQIQGFLKRDRCFIATAAFGSREAGPVRMLRLFRDRFLLDSTWGRSAVRWYYEASPALADWVSERPWARFAALAALAPLEALAFALLHPWLLVLPLLAAGLTLGAGWRSARRARAGGRKAG
jgi:hypothetical protein